MVERRGDPRGKEEGHSFKPLFTSIFALAQPKFGWSGRPIRNAEGHRDELSSDNVNANF